VTAGLFAYKFPSATRLVVAWLVPQFGAGNVGARRPDAGNLPYRMVTALPGTNDKIRQCTTVSVHTFDVSYDAAEASADVTDQRMMQLGPPIAPYQNVTIPETTVFVGGQIVTIPSYVVQPESVDTKMAPAWVDYESDLIFRFVGRYEIVTRSVVNQCPA
jgi:hypothetical protein